MTDVSDMEFYCPACGEYDDTRDDWTCIGPGYDYQERCSLCGTLFVISVEYREVEEGDCPKVKED
jgi:hypothetical protein